MTTQFTETLRALADERQAKENPSYLAAKPIVESVAVAFGITASEITGCSRYGSVVEARGVACYVLRHCTRMSFTEIGMAIGLHHTTVMSRVKGVAAKCVRDRWMDSVCGVLVEQFGATGKAGA